MHDHKFTPRSPSNLVSSVSVLLYSCHPPKSYMDPLMLSFSFEKPKTFRIMQSFLFTEEILEQGNFQVVNLIIYGSSFGFSSDLWNENTAVHLNRHLVSNHPKYQIVWKRLYVEIIHFQVSWAWLIPLLLIYVYIFKMYLLGTLKENISLSIFFPQVMSLPDMECM